MKTYFSFIPLIWFDDAILLQGFDNFKFKYFLVRILSLDVFIVIKVSIASVMFELLYDFFA